MKTRALDGKGHGQRPENRTCHQPSVKVVTPPPHDETKQESDPRPHDDDQEKEPGCRQVEPLSSEDPPFRLDSNLDSEAPDANRSMRSPTSTSRSR